MPDEAVRSAIAHWGPRFTAQGVDPNDFSRVTGSLERWDEWLDAWSMNADLHASLATEAEDANHTWTAGMAWVHAALSYHFANFVWMTDLDRRRAASEKAVDAIRRALALLDPGAERLEIPIEGQFIYGNLRRPPETERAPVVLLIPGLDSTKEEFFHIENLFLRRGMATLSMEGPGQGEAGYSSYIRADYERAVGAVLDALSERTDIAADRAGALGVSLGGYYAVRAAAFEPRLAAVCASGGPYDYGEIMPNRPSHSRATFVYHCGSSSEEEAFAKARELCLAGIASEVRQPLLVVAGKQDGLVPWEHAARVASEAPQSTFWLFDEGNHVCTNIAYRWRPQAADWMRGQLERPQAG